MSDFNYSLYVAFPLVTVFWLIVAIAGIIVPFIIRKNPNRGVIGTSIVLTAVCCYLFWLIAFLSQLHPLIGPEIENGAVGHMRRSWSGYGNQQNMDYPCYPNW